MPRDTGLPPGTLAMLILRVVQDQPLHGYAIAQRIHQLSREQLSVEEGSLYPALQKLLLKGWVTVCGDSVLSLRGFSVLFGCATLVGIYLFVKELERNVTESG